MDRARWLTIGRIATPAALALALLPLGGQGLGQLAAQVSPEDNSPPDTVVAPVQEIYDPGLGVTWLADADLAATDTFGVSGINTDGSMIYLTALNWVGAMNQDHYLGHSDWSLPVTPTPSTDPKCRSNNSKHGGRFGFGCTTSPLASLYTHTLGYSWPATVVAVPDTKTGPFHDFQPFLYWSSTPAPKKLQGFDTLSFNTGVPGANIPRNFLYVLPVLPGDPFHVGGLRGLLPVDNDQAVYEPGVGPGRNGVTWLADADLPRTQTFDVDGFVDSDGSVQLSTVTHQWLPAMNARRWLGKTGWALPTRDELVALYHALVPDRAAAGRPGPLGLPPAARLLGHPAIPLLVMCRAEHPQKVPGRSHQRSTVELLVRQRFPGDRPHEQLPLRDGIFPGLLTTRQCSKSKVWLWGPERALSVAPRARRWHDQLSALAAGASSRL